MQESEKATEDAMSEAWNMANGGDDDDPMANFLKITQCVVGRVDMDIDVLTLIPISISTTSPTPTPMLRLRLTWTSASFNISFYS